MILYIQIWRLYGNVNPDISIHNFQISIERIIECKHRHHPHWLYSRVISAQRTLYYKQNRCGWIGKGRGLTPISFSERRHQGRLRLLSQRRTCWLEGKRVKSTLGEFQNKQRIRAETRKQSLLLLREQSGGEKPQCFHGYFVTLYPESALVE